jgi:hypothetical protein
MSTEVLSLISVVIALSAVLVAIFAARDNAHAAERSRVLPVISEALREWRSPEIIAHRRRLINLTGLTPPEGGFEELPAEIRESAYSWCYYCDTLGQLALYKIVPEEIIIGYIGTQLIQVWCIMEPFILKEREHRARTLPPGAPAAFLPYYEHLVCRIAERGGRRAGEDIRKSVSARQITPEVRAFLGKKTALEDAT